MKQEELQQEEFIQLKAKQRQEEYIKQQQQNIINSNSSSNNYNIDDISTRTNDGGSSNNNNGMFYNALLSMHDNDANGKQLEKSVKKGGQKMKTQKGGVIKKSRQIKHPKR